jgi:hypothetical protein
MRTHPYGDKVGQMVAGRVASSKVLAGALMTTGLIAGIFFSVIKALEVGYGS